MIRIQLGLLPRILIAIVLGILVGQFLPDLLARVFVTFNAFFMEFLSFIIPLIILGLVVPAISDIGKSAGKMLLMTAGIAYIATLISGFFSYTVSSLTFPSLIDKNIQFDQVESIKGLTPYFELPIPPVMNIMTALVLAFTLGIGLAHLPSTHLKNVFADFKEIIIKTIQTVILPILPLYIFGIFMNMSYTGQVWDVLTVFIKIIGIIFAMHIFLLVAQYCIAALFNHKNPFKMLYTMLPAYFTALGTQSSAATIPVTLQRTKCNGVSSDVADFVVPLCATIHLSGSTLKITACALALMMMEGIPYTFGTFSGFIFMLSITMVAAPGVPGGAIMASLGILSSMLGFSQSDLALMIALHVAMDSFGTACNVTGDGAIAVIVDRISKKF